MVNESIDHEMMQQLTHCKPNFGKLEKFIKFIDAFFQNTKIRKVVNIKKTIGAKFPKHLIASGGKIAIIHELSHARAT